MSQNLNSEEKNKCNCCGGVAKEGSMFCDNCYNGTDKDSTASNGGSKKKLSACGWCAIIFFVFAVIIIGNAGDDTYSTSTSTQTSKTYTADTINYVAEYFAKQYVEYSLKAPSTAEFSSDVAVAQGADGNYVVTGYVDAENSFGATLRSYYEVTMSYSGGYTYGGDNDPLWYSTNWSLIDIYIE
jgi:hypothetical protein